MMYESIRKALDVATLESDYLRQELFDTAIRDFVSVEPVVYNTAVTRIPWAASIYAIRKRTSNPTATWSADGASMPAATKARHTKKTMAMSYLYTAGEVTGPAVKAAGSLINAMQMDIEAHSRAIVEELSENIVTGVGTSDDLEGMVYQLVTNADFNAGSAGIDVSGRADPTITLEMLDEAIDNSRGQVDLIITSPYVSRTINGLLQTYQRFPESVEVNGGFRVRSYEGRPILTTPEWTGGDDEILFIRKADSKLLVHEDFNYNELGRVKDAVSYFIKGYFGYVLEGRPTRLFGFDLNT